MRSSLLQFRFGSCSSLLGCSLGQPSLLFGLQLGLFFSLRQKPFCNHQTGFSGSGAARLQSALHPVKSIALCCRPGLSPDLAIHLVTGLCHTFMLFCRVCTTRWQASYLTAISTLPLANYLFHPLSGLCPWACKLSVSTAFVQAHGRYPEPVLLRLLDCLQP